MVKDRNTREESTRPERPGAPAKRTTRRAFIKTGVAVAGGIIVVGEYVKPMLYTVPIANVAQAYVPPPPPGQGSIDVKKTIGAVTTTLSGNPIGGTMSGSITVENMSDEPVPVTVIYVNDFVEYRLNRTWTVVPSITFSTNPQLLGSSIDVPPNNVKTYTYNLAFGGVPAGAKALRNTIEITVQGRSMVFVASASVESDDPEWN